MKKAIAFGGILAGTWLAPPTTQADWSWIDRIREGVVGNGGDVVVCRRSDGIIKSVELLDYYEAQKINGFSIDLGAGTLPVLSKVHLALDRLQALSPYRVEIWKAQAAAFESEAAFVPDARLVDVPDSQHVAVPNGCQIEQVAIQRDPTFEGEKRYVVSKDLWDLMGADDRAGLILHELIYRELKETQKNSITTRFFNGTLASDRFAGSTLPGFVNFAERAGFTWIEAHGVTYKPGSLIFHPNGRLKSGHASCWKGRIKVLGTDLLPCGPFEFFANGRVKSFSSRDGLRARIAGQEVTIRSGAFHENNQLAEIWLKREDGYPTLQLDAINYRIVVENYRRSNGKDEWAEGHDVKFHSNGKLRSCFPCHGKAVIQGSPLVEVENLDSGNQILEFHPNGALKRGEIVSGQDVEVAIQGRKFKIVDIVELAENGQILAAILMNGTNERLKVGRIEARFSGYVSFYPSGNVRTGILNEDLQLPFANGEKRDLKAGTQVEFNENGLVARVLD